MDHPRGDDPFRQLFEQAGAAMALVARDGRIRQVNHAFCRLLDQPAAKLIDRPWTDWSRGDRRDQEALFERLVGGNRDLGRVGGLWLCGDGVQPVRLSLWTTGVDDDDPVTVMVEPDPSAPDDDCGDLLESLAEGLIVVDGEGRIRRANAAAAAMIGRPADDLIGQPARAVLQDHRRPETCALVATLADGIPRRARYETFRRTDGAAFPVEVNAVPRRAGGVVVTFQDITARREAEAVSRTSQERFRQIVENIEEVFWLREDGRDARGHRVSRMLYVSPAFTRIWGLPVARLEADPQVFATVAHPDDREDLDRALADHFDHGRMACRFRIVRDGEVRWVQVRTFPVARSGALRRTAGVARDITDQVIAETERSHLAELLAATPDLVAMADPEGQLTYCNPAAARMFDPGPAGIPVGRTLRDCHPPWAVARLENEGLPTAERDGVWAGDTAICDPTGREIPVSQVVLAHRDPQGVVQRFSTIIRDLSERQAWATRVETQARLLETVLGTIPNPIFYKDNAGRYVTCNRAFADQVLGRPVGEIIGRTVADLVDAPGHVQRYQDADRDLLAQGGVQTYEAPVRYADGSERAVLFTKATVQDPEGRIEGLVGLMLDMTAERAVQSALARSNQDLETFAYAISHDLKEPLRMVSSFLELLERHQREHLDGRGREFMDFARDGARRMARMIDDLLTYSRVTSRAAPPAPVSADEALDAALAHLRTALAEADADLVRTPLPDVMADSAQLVRLFQNLIGNALKYRPRDRRCRIRIKATQIGPQIRFDIADNGPGIPEASRDQAFAVFQRLGAQAAEGSGIGLAVCKRIVERHGGQIWIETAEEGGCLLRFTLPVAAKQNKT